MAFRRRRGGKELEIISLIDIVFLLIIFGIIASVLAGAGQDSDNTPTSTFKITLQREAERPDVHRQPGLVVTILNSDEQGTVYTDILPPDNELLAMSQAAFENQPACALLRSRISYFAENMALGTKISSEHVEVIAGSDTKFRVIGFILRECAAYKDLIPWVRVAGK